MSAISDKRNNTGNHIFKHATSIVNNETRDIRKGLRNITKKKKEKTYQKLVNYLCHGLDLLSPSI
jgi:hypothetical protein